MQLTLIHQPFAAADAGLTQGYAVASSGDVLAAGGRSFNFGDLAEGDVLPARAAPLARLAGPVTREDGDIHASLFVPRDGMGVEAELPEGLVAAPIDWSLVETAVNREAVRLAAWRAQASLTRADFAIRAMLAGLITDAEARSWATGNAAPAVVDAAIATLPEAHRTPAWIDIMSRATIARTHPALALVQSTMGLTDAQVDALFLAMPA
jgi:hypothetical protein